jgi:hypothetical protein
VKRWRSFRAHLHTFIKLPFFRYSFEHLHGASANIEGMAKEMKDLVVTYLPDEVDITGPSMPLQYQRALYM